MHPYRLVELVPVLSCPSLPSPAQVDALRLRLEEKETTLNKKSKQIQEMSEEKGTLNGEIHDLKDMLEVKERKVNVLQKKVTLNSAEDTRVVLHHDRTLKQTSNFIFNLSLI